MSAFLDALNAPPEPPETVHLFSRSLLSKWGFGDGDDFDWLRDFGDCDKHAVLCAVVREKLLPMLDQKVEVQEIGTCHNPIRATRVDGATVNPYLIGDEQPIKLTPEYVVVTGGEIVAIARRIGQLK